MTEYKLSFLCNYPGGHTTRHNQVMPLRDIKKWIEAYHYTHPAVESISVMVWLGEPREGVKK